MFREALEIRRKLMGDQHPVIREHTRQISRSVL
jgi:hypothetical protein